MEERRVEDEAEVGGGGLARLAWPDRWIEEGETNRALQSAMR